MKTLKDVLREADPVGSETRAPDRRAITRSSVLARSRETRFDARPAPRWRAMAVAAVLAAIAISTAVFAWRHASVDAVAAVRFEARLAESQQTILNNRDILNATVVAGNSPSTFNISLKFTPEGAEKMQRMTGEHIGEHLQLLIDGEVVIAPLIRSAISSDALLTGNYTSRECERIIDGLLKGKLELATTK